MHVRILGSLEILSRAGEPVRLSTRKTSLLLATLALAEDKGVRREFLSEALWPDRGEAQARGSLRQALAAVRRIFPDSEGVGPRIDGDLEWVRLTARPDDVDIWLFDRLIAHHEPAKMARAADLYRGDVLADMAVPASLDDWLAPHRQAYRRKALILVERLSLLPGPHLVAIEPQCQALAERLLASDPGAEEAHRALIRLHHHHGRRNAAIRQFDLCKAALQHELGAEPEPQTCELVAHSSDGRPAAGEIDAPAMGRSAAAAPAPAPAVPHREQQPSVVILPFDNLSGEADEYFVDGMVEEITAALSRVREFFVIARQSAFAYKGRFVDVREIGSELGVRYVVEGTVRRGGERLRISVQLVDADTRTQLWSERYEGVSTDVFEFQDRIAAQVAGAIQPAVRHAEIELAKRLPPASLRAYDLVMRAYPKLWGHNRAANDEAIALLQDAIRSDPTYGRAHALLAWCHAVKATYVWSAAPEEEHAMALAAVEVASVAIDDDPTALTAAGAAVSLCGDQERATAFFERALMHDPNNAWAWTRFGWTAIYRGELDRARERFERAMTLSPVDPFAFNMRMGIASSLAFAGNLSEALAIARDVINRHPDVTWCYRQLAAWSAWAGDLATARWAAKKLLAAQPDFTIARYRALPFFRNLPHHRDKMVNGLRLAGLPET